MIVVYVNETHKLSPLRAVRRKVRIYSWCMFFFTLIASRCRTVLYISRLETVWHGEATTTPNRTESNVLCNANARLVFRTSSASRLCLSLECPCRSVSLRLHTFSATWLHRALSSLSNALPCVAFKIYHVSEFVHLRSFDAVDFRCMLIFVCGWLLIVTVLLLYTVYLD